MDVTIATVGAAIAVVATSVGTVVAVDQLTLPSRLRRLEGWARESLKHDSQGPRAEILKHIRARTTARLVGGIYAPGHHFIEAAVWSVLGPSLVVISITRDETWHERAVLVVVAFTSVLLSARRAIRVYLERQRIIKEYLAGAEPIEPPRLSLVAQMEGGTRTEFGLAALIAGGFCTIAGAIGWFLSGYRGEGLLVPTFVGIGLLIVPNVVLRAATVPLET